MSNDGDASVFEFGGVGHFLSNFDGITGIVPFGDHHDHGCLSALMARAQGFNQPGNVRGAFGYQYFFRAPGEGGNHGDIATVTAHDLDEENAVVGRGGIAHPVDSFHGGVDGRVEANGVFRAANIVVDGAGQADAGDAVLGVEGVGTAVGAISADHHDAFFFGFQYIRFGQRELIAEGTGLYGVLEGPCPPFGEGGHGIGFNAAVKIAQGLGLVHESAYFRYDPIAPLTCQGRGGGAGEIGTLKGLAPCQGILEGFEETGPQGRFEAAQGAREGCGPGQGLGGDGAGEEAGMPAFFNLWKGPQQAKELNPARHIGGVVGNGR